MARRDGATGSREARLTARARRSMIDLAIREEKKPAGAAGALCWICNRNKADSGEHKTKRSDLLAVLGTPSQEQRSTIMMWSDETKR